MMPAKAHKVRATRGEKAAAPGTLVVEHATELLTLRGPPGPRAGAAAAELGIVEDGAVYVEGDRIVDVGTASDVQSRHPRADVRIDAAGCVMMPGFVDAHTHTVFAGSREHEVEWKARGLGYAEIAARGGGILSTVRATRDASEDELVRTGSKRLRSMLASGTTTLEVKTGYGLRTDDEVKMLRATARAASLAGVDVVSTFLGAHAIPPEYDGRPDAYVDLVSGEMLEAVQATGLATFCDVFVDEGYFTPEQARRILEKAKVAGLLPKIHADELAETGGAALAAELSAVSADHLAHASGDGIDAMARAGVIGVLLPATSLASRLPFADGRRLVAAGVPVALGTDFNPNCWCESLQLAAALACHHNGLVPAEAIVASTINAAHAVGRAGDVGSLEPGKQADLLVLDIPSHRHLGYRIGGNAVRTVVKRGRVNAASR
ncbi:MAG TPA: imidazolonepropionase [Thermoplasmata archaeon]